MGEKGKDAPGPAVYNTNLSSIRGPRYQFGTSKREEHRKKETSPGPGHYKLPVKFAEVPRYALPNQKEEFKFV